MCQKRTTERAEEEKSENKARGRTLLRRFCSGGELREGWCDLLQVKTVVREEKLGGILILEGKATRTLL